MGSRAKFTRRQEEPVEKDMRVQQAVGFRAVLAPYPLTPRAAHLLSVALSQTTRDTPRTGAAVPSRGSAAARRTKSRSHRSSPALQQEQRYLQQQGWASAPKVTSSWPIMQEALECNGVHSPTEIKFFSKSCTCGSNNMSSRSATNCLV